MSHAWAAGLGRVCLATFCPAAGLHVDVQSSRISKLAEGFAVSKLEGETDVEGTALFGTTKVLAERMLKYCKASWWGVGFNEACSDEKVEQVPQRMPEVPPTWAISLMGGGWRQHISLMAIRQG